MPSSASGKQYFDPSEPWDVQSAEALTRLCESAEGDPRKDPHGDRARCVRPRQPEAAAAPPAGESPVHDRAWLDARLADIAERLQTSLAGLDPDKTVAPLTRRLDLIEERFSEALARVAQRSDFEGLRLIEAHVLELAAHLEQSRGRLDRIESIDDQLRGLVRLEEGDQQRLDALEKLLHDYVAEWRRSEERTTSALTNLEDAVSRIGDSVEAMEASKPAPDLLLSVLGAPGFGSHPVASDPLSQVYADAGGALGPKGYRSTLDAADYAPKAAEAARLLVSAAAGDLPVPPADAHPAEPPAAALSAPAFRALAMRARLRQAQILTAEADTAAAGERPARAPAKAVERDPALPPATKRTRPGILLAAGATLFGAAGYLLVDAFLSAPPGRSHQASHGAQPADAKAARSESTSLPADGARDVGPRQDRPAPAAPPAHRPKAPESDDHAANAAPKAPKGATVEAFSHAIAALFHSKSENPAAGPVTTAALHKDTPATADDAAAPITAPPMTIGPASLRQAAMSGDPAAQLEVAARYAAGRGVEQDLPQALQWYRRAAAKGLAQAQFRLAAMHERGLGTATDPDRARAWYARAAEQGHVKAMHNLAVLSVGGGRSDYAAAAKWFGQAADHGLADSQFNLAVLQQNGLGVPKDLLRAYKWLALAARAGDREAAGRVPLVKAQLAAAEVEAADAMIAAWRALTPDPRVNEAAAGS